jgi:hypothetical protein
MPPDEAPNQGFSEQRATINTRVTSLLERFPEARSSDRMLFQIFAKEFDKLDLPICQMSVSLVSIVRERRRIQKNRPDLRATEKVQEFREKFAKSYQDYYKTSEPNQSESSFTKDDISI